MSTLITEYPIWFIIFCIVAGLLYAWLLYRKENRLEEAPKFVIKGMFIFRFFTVSIIAFLLLTPVLKLLGRTAENPIIVFAQDNSESVLSEKNISLKAYNQLKSHFINENLNYDFKTYTFGEEVAKRDEFKFEEKETDISEIINDIKNRYFHRNIGALIISGDGINNSGENPFSIIENLSFPVYTIALGDTTLKPDILINDAKSNKIAFLNNRYPVSVNIRSDKLKGEKSKIAVFDNGKKIIEKKINITNDDFFQKFEFQIPAIKTGFHKILIRIDSTGNEINLQNNTKQLYVEVADSKQKILILANSPHPDISALRQALELNQNFDTEYYTISDFNKSPRGYNLIILHQIPSQRSSSKILSDIINANIPILYILGKQTSLAKFDNLNTGLISGAFSNKADNVNGVLNNKFSLFEIDPQIEKISLQSPPMLSPFGTYRLNIDSEILFYRKIKNINTELPLIAFTSVSGGKKTGIITGEGIWRWSLYDYKMNQNNYLFNDLINKTIQYLTEKDIKERFNVNYEKIIAENQNLIFKAQFYSEDYKLINEPEISIILKDSSDITKTYQFEKVKNTYILNAGQLIPGEYTWTSEFSYKGKKFQKEGILSVIQINIESDNMRANHNLLYRISNQTGGKLFYPNETDKLINEIENNENIVTVSYSEKKTESIINYKLIFFLLLILLTSEWFARKFYGAY